MQPNHEQQRPTRKPRAALVAAVLAGALVLAGCGSGSPATSGTKAANNSGPTSARTTAGSKSGAASTDTAAGGQRYGSGTLAFSKCMRANGVPQFPDLRDGRMRIGANGQSLSVNGVSVSAPAFGTARRICQRYLPHTHATPEQTARQVQQALNFSRCMRSHGVPHFPDAQTRAGSGGNQEAFLPGVNLNSPAVKSAARACGGGPKGP